MEQIANLMKTHVATEGSHVRTHDGIIYIDAMAVLSNLTQLIAIGSWDWCYLELHKLSCLVIYEVNVSSLLLS